MVCLFIIALNKFGGTSVIDNILKLLKKFPMIYLILIILVNGLFETFTDYIDKLIYYLAYPLSSVLQLQTIMENDMLKVLYFGLILFVYYFLLKGIKSIKQSFEKDGNSSFDGTGFEKELSAAIANIEEPNVNPEEKKQTILNFITEFERWIGNILELNQRQYKCHWIFPMGRKNWLSLYTDANSLTENEKELIDYLVRRPNPRFHSTDVSGHISDSLLEEIIFVKNFGRLRLGFTVLIYQKGILTDRKKQEFSAATSYLLLMGYNTKLINELITLRRG
jgi:hypothetical protein